MGTIIDTGGKTSIVNSNITNSSANMNNSWLRGIPPPFPAPGNKGFGQWAGTANGQNFNAAGLMTGGSNLGGV